MRGSAAPPHPEIYRVPPPPRARRGAIIRQLPKITDTYEDIQNLKIQNNAYWRDMQKYDWLS